MGFLDFIFGKKEDTPQYDPTDVRITDLKKGFIIDYDLKSWVVKEEYEYDWGENHFSKEYKIDCGDDTAFLSIDADDEVHIQITRKIRIRDINNDLPEYIEKNQYPPTQLKYNGLEFSKNNESPGYFNDPAKSQEWNELISWDYYENNGGKHVLNIEQWGEREFEASFGIIVSEHDISNIIPA